MVRGRKADSRRLAHDLRNHLFTIDLSLQSLEEDPTPERLAETLRQIRTELAAAEKIAGDLQGAEPGSPER
jgi:hypothetical protein